MALRLNRRAILLMIAEERIASHRGCKLRPGGLSLLCGAFFAGHIDLDADAVYGWMM
jgi:hypothetical protein